MSRRALGWDRRQDGREDCAAEEQGVREGKDMTTLTPAWENLEVLQNQKAACHLHCLDSS